MFTGIIEEIGKVERIQKDTCNCKLSIKASKILEDIHLGDSIAVNGICLTVTCFTRQSFTVDVMNETWNRTALSLLRHGSLVNLERAMPMNGRLGGHIVTGHIDGTGRISSVRRDKNAVWYQINTQREILNLIVEKGSIAIDGISLTVAKVSKADFSVSVIPHTLEQTILKNKQVGDDFMLDCLTAGGKMKRLDLAINDKAGILDIPKLKEKYKAGECISYFRMQKDYSGTEKCGSDLPKNTGETLYLGSTSSELYMCAYQKNYEQYVKNGIEVEDTEIKNRFEIRMKNERAYYAVVDLLTYRDAERTAFSIINHYVRFVDREDDKPKSQWKTNDDWAWFIGENREPIRLTTKPEPYTLQKALHWLQRQVAPTIKMVQALDRENHTTILKDMIEQAELKDKHKHLLQLEKSTIEERIDTAVPQENDGIF